MGAYRIVQISDNEFVVEQFVMIAVHQRGWLWWKKFDTEHDWRRIGWIRYISGFPRPPLLPAFKSEAAAQKWIDDKHKYPIVVKEPA